MKIFCLLFLFSIVACVKSFAQSPTVKWNRHYTNVTNEDNYLFFDMKPTNDKGFIMVGTDTSGVISDLDLINKSSGWGGIWIVKTDSAGNEAWNRTPFFAGKSALTSVQQTTDGGYITAGSGNYPDASGAMYVIKIDPNGSTQWQKQLGGTGSDRAYSVIQTFDGGYLAAGTTTSNNGNVSSNHNVGTDDAWIIKLNASGTIVWNKSFGGSGWDTATAIVQTADKGFIIAGSSTSVNGDLTGNKGNSDGWLFKTDSLGVLQWQKNYGGSGVDCFKNVTLTEDGNIIASGYTRSADGNVLGNHGAADVWVVMTDASGNLKWSKCFGGTGNEYGMSIQRTLDNEYLLGGFTNTPNNSDVNGQNGGNDMWMLLISKTGNLIWQKCVGTANNEYGSTAMAISPNNFVMAGASYYSGTRPYGIYDGSLVTFGNANFIKGNVYLDANLNGILDNDETGFDDLKINIEKAGVVQSTQPFRGQFNINTDIGTYTSSFIVNSPAYSVVATSHVSTFTTYLNTDSFDIAVQPHPNQQDLSISLLPVTPARPGFIGTYKLSYRNAGTVTMPNGIFKFVKDPHTGLAGPIPGAVVTGDTIAFSYTPLKPQDSAAQFIYLQLQIPPVLNNGDTLHFMAIIDPIAGDLTPADNTSRLKQIVTGSFDPNDISEANAGKITRQQLTNGEYLNYLIRFQNTGTDTAFTITVKDTLESKLDWSTLQMVSSSHAYQLSVNNNNQLSWLFNNVNLVDSNHNEPASHGYIAYRIKPKSTLADGDIINNRASIYFDYNLPVQTNTEQTLLAANVALPVSLLKWNAALNNDKVLLSWQTSFENNVAYFEIQYSTDGRNFAGIGKRTARNSAIGSSYAFNHPDFVKGNNFYRLATVDADGSIHYSNTLVIYAGANREIVSSVYPNPASGAITINLRGELKGNAMVSVFDLSGKQLLSFSSGNLATSSYSSLINIGSLSKGVYIIEFKLNDYLQRKKLIVQ